MVVVFIPGLFLRVAGYALLGTILLGTIFYPLHSWHIHVHFVWKPIYFLLITLLYTLSYQTSLILLCYYQRRYFPSATYNCLEVLPWTDLVLLSFTFGFFASTGIWPQLLWQLVVITLGVVMLVVLEYTSSWYYSARTLL
jgi:hypothetical protein